MARDRVDRAFFFQNRTVRVPMARFHKSVLAKCARERKNGRPPHLCVPSGRLKHLGRIQNLLIMLTSCYVIFTLAVYSATLTTELPSFLQTMNL